MKDKRVRRDKNKIVVNLSNCQYELLRNVATAFKYRVSTDRDTPDFDLFWTDWCVS